MLSFLDSIEHTGTCKGNYTYLKGTDLQLLGPNLEMYPVILRFPQKGEF